MAADFTAVFVVFQVVVEGEEHAEVEGNLVVVFDQLQGEDYFALF